ncbi:uncharacterized protein [Lolium perenne]|uniref:uncharacterized protein n=1 Tax=Lolium perenne TaxID=4522 RepID=UPI003A9A32E0
MDLRAAPTISPASPARVRRQPTPAGRRRPPVLRLPSQRQGAAGSTLSGRPDSSRTCVYRGGAKGGARHAAAAVQLGNDLLTANWSWWSHRAPLPEWTCWSRLATTCPPAHVTQARGRRRQEPASSTCRWEERPGHQSLNGMMMVFSPWLRGAHGSSLPHQGIEYVLLEESEGTM